ncbi:MAG: xanthine dehydrogenase family protein molybdopterin-binding subunit [Chloroflexi bacterium]|nr:xanthine dehydrogenase family protein molybdopterin-binding subunit [Chloroflexota bacterium]
MTTTEKPQEFKVVGTRPIRHDGIDKVLGRAVYGSDVRLAGMIYGAVLRSPYAHAKITKIDTSKAEAMPGVFAVMSGKDMPLVASGALDLGETVDDTAFTSDRVMAHDKVVFKGPPVAAVAAIDQNTGLEALKLIEVEYEVLKPVISLEDAMAPGAVVIHEGLIGDDLGEKVNNTNIAVHNRSEFGDPEAAFAKSATVLERTFIISRAHQGYIEPHASTAFWAPDGKITVWTTTQAPFGVRKTVSALLEQPLSDIKVIPTEIGGGFGGKIPVYLEPVAAVLSKKAGRPVKITMDRRAVFEASGPGPGGTIKVKMGVDDKGKITAATADIRYGAGAYPGASINPATAGIFACYEVPNVRIDSYDVVINMSKTAAYRAPGTPQATFASETLVGELCEIIGMSPMDFHLLNVSREGTRRPDGPVFPRIGNEACLEAIQGSEHFKSTLEPSTESKLRGRGMASGYWNGIGNKSSVTINVNEDGLVSLIEGNPDIGGTRTTIAMQAAEILGLPAEDVHPAVGDTDSIGYSDLTAGSRTTYATGTAAIEAAKMVIDEMKKRVAMIWETEYGNIEHVDGLFVSKVAPDHKFTFKEAAGKLGQTGGPVAMTGTVNVRGSGGGSFGTHLVDVEVDRDTGKVEILRYTAAQDAGKAVHPSYVEGQFQGGAVQGIGWALNEEYYTSDDGVMVNSTFLDYRMPTSLDVPMIETIIVEVANTNHPFGVRGIGETSIVPPAPAVANALANAIGVRLYQTPMNPGRILEALATKKTGK